MERYTLQQLYTEEHDLREDIADYLDANFVNIFDDDNADDMKALGYISRFIYYEFFEDLVAYAKETLADIKTTFIQRLGYDIAVKFQYWKVKYHYILDLFDRELSLLQTSKMTSSSQEDVNSAGGVIQKSASTPTGVSTGTGDTLEISATIDQTGTLDVGVDSSSFADKYTNYQGKTSTGNKTSGTRSGEVLREGSIKELLEVLEKMPSSFGDEITKAISKHFEFVYSY